MSRIPIRLNLISLESFLDRLVKDVLMVLPLLLSHVACLFLSIVASILLQLVIGTLSHCVLVQRRIVLDLLGCFQVFHLGDLGACQRVEELQS